MRTERLLSAFTDFTCIAGRCPETCCTGWEIDVDRDALSFYALLPREKKEKICARITVTPFGGRIRIGKDKRCPFLTQDNLCELQKDYGEKALCEVCRTHPRFYRELGSVRETDFSLSCPHATDLLFLDPDIHVVTRPLNGNPVLNDLSYETVKETESLRGKLLDAVKNAKEKSDALSILSTIVPIPRSPAYYGEKLLKVFSRAKYAKKKNREVFLSAIKRAFDGENGVLSDEIPFLDKREQNILYATVFSLFSDAVYTGNYAGELKCAVAAFCAMLSLKLAYEKEGCNDALSRAARTFTREIVHSDKNLQLLKKSFAK